MPAFRTCAIAGATLLLAAVACTDALARVTSRRLPGFAAGLPISDGFAESRWASVQLSRGIKPGALPKPRLGAERQRRVKEQLREAYRSEPLNQDTLRNLALLAEAEGGAAMARNLMLASERLSRRDLATNLWLAGDHLRRGRIDEGLKVYDQALRTSSRGRDVLIPAMLEHLRNDALVPPVVSLLSGRPPWEDAFWATAPRYRRSLLNIGRVRMAVARQGIAIDPRHDRMLVAELASAGHFATARQLAMAFGPRIGLGQAEIVANSEFGRIPDFPPFDWELATGSFLTTEIRAREGNLRVSTFADGSGRVARQIVALPDRVYTLAVKASNWDALDRNALYVRLDCAEEGPVARSRPLYIDRADFRQAFAKPQRDCTYHWLTLYAAEQPSQHDNIVTLERLSLTPGARGQDGSNRAK